MLRFPLPSVPDSSLPIRNLSYETNQLLCHFLDHNDQCTIILQFINSMSPGAVVQNRGNLTASAILSLLDRLNCKVRDLDRILERCSILEPLYLLRFQVPVSVNSQPVTKMVVDKHQEVLLDFSVNGDAFPQPSFQWFLKLENEDTFQLLDGATSKSMVIPSFGSSNSGSYVCQITQLCREGHHLTLRTVPSFITLTPFAPFLHLEPEDCQAYINDTIELVCSADGYPTLRFQWCKNDQDLLGATEPSFLIPKVSLEDDGHYSCLISNSEGSITTRVARVTVSAFQPLTITYQPRFPNNAPQRAGSIIYLECNASGAEPIYFQWLCNGDIMINQTTKTLKVEALPQDGERELHFRCRVWNERHEMVESEVAWTTVDTASSLQQHKASMKIALLIGNWMYENIQGLGKVRADVKTLNDCLYKMGFDVISFCNLKKLEIKFAIRKFLDLLLPGAYVVLYYAGHGIFYMKDYVMPVDVPEESEYVLDDLVSVNEIVAEIQTSKPKLLTVFLDMCRVFPRRCINLHRGGNESPINKVLDPSELVLDSRSNLLIGYATSENRGAYEVQRDSNGIFMTFLKREIEQPNILIATALTNLQKRYQLERPEIVGDQIPQITKTLAEDLSLHDPIDKDFIGGMMWNFQQLKFHDLRKLPIPMKVPITSDGFVIDEADVHFTRMDDCFFNALQIQLTTKVPLNLLPRVQPSSLEIESIEFKQETKVKQETHQCTCSFVIHKLQALTEDAVLSFYQGDAPALIIPLGRPLIAAISAPAEPLNHF